MAFRLIIGVAVIGSRPALAQTAGDDPSAWQVEAFADVGYLHDRNAPANHLFRNRGTTPRVDKADVNMAGIRLRKTASESSLWAAELTAHAGKDSETFGFSATAPRIAGANVLLHLGPTNASYRAPVGSGLTIQGGIFNSFIGFDSLYAKDNFSYTRPWGADYTPYLMTGVNASYAFDANVSMAIFAVNGYWHLAHANDAPSFGGQVAYKVNDLVTVKETVLAGSHQTRTALALWRVLSDTIVERRTGRFVTAVEYQIGSEKVDVAGMPRALWTSAQGVLHWSFAKPWRATFRPEFCWDRDGRWIGAPQSVVAVTTTVEYRVPYRRTNTMLRLEHRFDHSRGAGGGFFARDDPSTGIVGLTPRQHLLILALIVDVDSAMHR